MKKKKKVKNFYKYYLLVLFLLFLFSYVEFSNKLSFCLFNDIVYSIVNIEDKKILDGLNLELKEENDDLKSLLEIDYSLTDFNIVYATIVARDELYYFDDYIINKGKVDGIKKDSVVVIDSGVIGKVVSVSLKTSYIRLINNIGDISVTVNNKNKIMNDNLIIRGINEGDGIKVGDLVSTSGLSNSFPKGLIIGNVSNIKKEKNGVGLIANISLSSDIDNIRFVAILMRKER